MSKQGYGICPRLTKMESAKRTFNSFQLSGKMEFGDREWVKSVKSPSGCFNLTFHYHETVCSVS